MFILRPSTRLFFHPPIQFHFNFIQWLLSNTPSGFRPTGESQPTVWNGMCETELKCKRWCRQWFKFTYYGSVSYAILEHNHKSKCRADYLRTYTYSSMLRSKLFSHSGHKCKPAGSLPAIFHMLLSDHNQENPLSPMRYL